MRSPLVRQLRDRGSATVELALLVPALVLMLGLAVAGGRVWFARTAVVDAAGAAARAASLSRTAAEAASSGAAAGRQSLSSAGLVCATTSVQVSTGAFAIPVGTPATVTASVDCTVSFSDLLLPGTPGSIEVAGRGASALDTYRSR